MRGVAGKKNRQEKQKGEIQEDELGEMWVKQRLEKLQEEQRERGKKRRLDQVCASEQRAQRGLWHSRWRGSLTFQA